MSDKERDVKRFESKFKERPNGCWIWNGTVSNGYAVMQFNGQIQQANRVAWEIKCGPIPDGKIVVRKCGDPLCVNPNHLYLTTRAEKLDKIRRYGKGKKITAEEVMYIRDRAGNGESQSALAKEFGVSRNLVNMIVNRKVWASV